VVEGIADVSSEIVVCLEMSRVNSRVISGLFGGPINCFIARNAAVSRGPDKDYVEVGGNANEVLKNEYTLDEGVRGVNVLDSCKGGEEV